MNTFDIWVLYTYATVDGLSVCDTFGFTDQAAAQAAGDAAVANPETIGLKPTGPVGFMVLPLQAYPL